MKIEGEGDGEGAEEREEDTVAGRGRGGGRGFCVNAQPYLVGETKKPWPSRKRKRRQRCEVAMVTALFISFGPLQ